MNLRDHVDKGITVLLPEFPTTELEDGIRELGFRTFVKTVSGEVDRPGRSAGDDPVADLAHGRPDRRLVTVGIRRRATRAQSERRAPGRT